MPNALLAPSVIASPSAQAVCQSANVAYSGTTKSGLVLLFACPSTVTVAGSALNVGGCVMTRLRARPQFSSGATVFKQTQAQLFKVDPNNNVLFDDDTIIPGQTLIDANGNPAPTAPGDFGYSIQSKRDLPAGWSWYVGIGTSWTPGVAFSGDIDLYQP